MAHRMSVYPSDETSTTALNSAYNTVQRAFLAKFLPNLPRAALENAIQNAKIRAPSSETPRATKILVENGTLTIGTTQTPVYVTEAVTKVPDILFYDVPQHVLLLEHLLQVDNLLNTLTQEYLVLSNVLGFPDRQSLAIGW